MTTDPARPPNARIGLDLLREDPPWPEVLQVEVTTRCNLKCVFCKNGALEVQSRGDVSVSLYRDVLEQGVGCWGRVNLWGTGEPLMHAGFFEMAELARDRGVGRVKVSTNGHLLSEGNVHRLLSSGVTEVRVALDAATPEEFRRVRIGGSFKKVVEGIGRLIEARARRGVALRVVICSVVSTADGAGVAEVESLARSLGADAHEPMPNIWSEQLPGLDLAEPRARCSQQLRVFNMLSNGDVIPCCHTYLGEVTLGNARSQRVEEIWRGAPARTARRAFLDGEFAFCARCNYGATLGGAR
ncbi:MAG: radical SAM/SPASM domain-containing protein [Polyangiales bacterium]